MLFDEPTSALDLEMGFARKVSRRVRRYGEWRVHSLRRSSLR